MLFDVNCSNIFSDLSPQVEEIKAKIDKWNLIKLESFCTAETTIDKMKDELQNGRKHLQMI